MLSRCAWRRATTAFALLMIFSACKGNSSRAPVRERRAAAPKTSGARQDPATTKEPTAAPKEPTAAPKPAPITSPEQIAGRWLAVTRMEAAAGPGLVETTPLSGLSPNLFVEVSGAFAAEVGARSFCNKRKGSTCAVRYAGDRYEPVTLNEARAAAKKLCPGVFNFARLITLRGRKVPLIIRERVTQQHSPRTVTDRKAILFWSRGGRVVANFKQRSDYVDCGKFSQSAAPAGLTVIRDLCSPSSCGGTCDAEAHVLAISHDDLARPVSFVDAWGDWLASVPMPTGTQTKPNAAVCAAAFRKVGQVQVPTLSRGAGKTTQAFETRFGAVWYAGGALCIPPASGDAPSGAQVLRPGGVTDPCAAEPRIKDDRPWAVIAALAPMCKPGARKLMDRKVEKLKQAGFGRAVLQPSTALSNFRCCFWTVIADRFKTVAEAKALMKLLRKKRFRPYAKEAF